MLGLVSVLEFTVSGWGGVPSHFFLLEFFNLVCFS